eukprot:1160405-Pelagomonas_calceolata.AAC.2
MYVHMPKRETLPQELIRRAKAYAKVLGAFANSGKVELSLLKYMQASWQVKASATIMCFFPSGNSLDYMLMERGHGLGKALRLCFQAEKHLEPHFALMLRVLYEVDVLSEDAILHWYHKGSDPAGRDVFLPQTEALVKWLEEESEEEEESD